MPTGIDLNSISPGFRDSLLNRNLKFSQTIEKYSYSHLAKGVGKPVDIGTMGSVIDSEDIIEGGEDQRILTTTLNKYQPSDSYNYPPTDFIEREIDQSLTYTSPVNQNINETGEDQRTLTTGVNKYQPSKSYNFPPSEFVQKEIEQDLVYSAASSQNIIEGGKKSREDVINFNEYQPTDLIERSIDITSNYSEVYDGYDYTQTLDNSNSETSKINDVIRERSLKSNLYVNNNLYQASLPATVSQYSEQKDTYIDENGSLNIGDGGQAIYNILGTLSSGESLLIGSDGSLAETANIRTTLLGRTLNAGSATKDTPLGVIGRKQLGVQLINNIGANITQSTVGRINTNVPDLLRGGKFIVPNYTITTQDSLGKKALDYTAKIIGFGNGLNLFNKGIIEDAYAGGNIAKANELLNSTGKGQKNIFYGNINKNRYRAGYTDSNLFSYAYMTDEGEVDYKETIITNRLDDDTNLSVNVTTVNDSIVSERFEDFKSTIAITSEFGKTDVFSWDNESDREQIDPLNKVFGRPDSPGYSVNSILYKTRRLFDSGKMFTLIDRKSRGGDYDSQVEYDTTVSKGSAVRNNNGDLCRVWTKRNQYDSVEDLQRKGPIVRALDIENVKANSVLNENGFVKISPEKKGPKEQAQHKYMFSIENLAWADLITDLKNDETLECEIGPGDPSTGTRGRIMWFPPYDISFNETTSVNWDRHDFIGRPEPMYTYNNSERTGTLSFKVVVDHPSILNQLKGDKYYGKNRLEEFERYFAGCGKIPDNLKGYFTITEQNEIEKSNVNKAPTTKETNPPEAFQEFNVYFLNDVFEYIPVYEDGDGTPYGKYAPNTINNDGSGSKTLGGINDDTKDGGRNVFFNDEILFGDKLLNYVKENKGNVIIEINGSASSAGTGGRNKVLAETRARNIKQKLIDKLGFEINDDNIRIITTEPSTRPTNNSSDDIAKDDRSVRVKAYVDVTKDTSINSPDIEDINEKQKTINNERLKELVGSRLNFISECDYFKYLKDNFTQGVDAFHDKLDFFSPTFHSTTPEGFNKRLTFLLQCTKPGNTTGSNTSNLAFGKPPICILRIGDFYHTKIIIDSVSFDFEPLIWDLNPDGIGVQPMIATVNLSIKFLGGSSLVGPISKLQNAISHNFFANTEVYNEDANKEAKANIKPKEVKEETDKTNKNPTNPDKEDVTKDQVAEAEKDIIDNDPVESKFSLDDVTANQINQVNFSSLASNSLNPNTVDLNIEFSSDNDKFIFDFEVTERFELHIYKKVTFDNLVFEESTNLIFEGSAPKVIDLGAKNFEADLNKTQTKTFNVDLNGVITDKITKIDGVTIVNSDNYIFFLKAKKYNIIVSLSI